METVEFERVKSALQAELDATLATLPDVGAIDAAPGAVSAVFLPVVMDQELMFAFRDAMLARKQRSHEESPEGELCEFVAVDESDEESGGESGEDSELTKITKTHPIENREAPVGFAHPAIGVRPSKVGGFIPTTVEKNYALKKVKSIREIMLLSATVEPTDFTLEELDRLEGYNITLVARKNETKKG